MVSQPVSTLLQQKSNGESLDYVDSMVVGMDDDTTDLDLGIRSQEAPPMHRRCDAVAHMRSDYNSLGRSIRASYNLLTWSTSQRGLRGARFYDVRSGIGVETALRLQNQLDLA